MTEPVVAPLDAYATAKPDEPTFTLQGGDPLAAPLVRTWALLARRRAGLARFEEGSFAELIEAAIGSTISEDDDRERDNLKLRATAAEQVSWVMDEYIAGGFSTDKPTEAVDTHLTELERIDLHDLRVRIAGRLSNFHSEIVEMCDALLAREFDVEVLGRLAHAGTTLSELNKAIEPRRMFKKD